jgi:hypothetical protein
MMDAVKPINGDWKLFRFMKNARVIEYEIIV